MTTGTYSIRVFQPADTAPVIALLQVLWARNKAARQAAFAWKYIKNPCASQPLGVVALCGDEVVGFRGYMASRWYVPASGRQCVVLGPGDTCVDPQHRNQGLSVRMGKLAMAEFSRFAPLSLNTTGSRSSLPGYQKLGFAALARKKYCSVYSSSGLARYISGFGKEQQRSLPLSAGDIAVSNTPRPREMARLAASQASGSRKLQLARDEQFYRWRFENPLGRYVFYFAGPPEKLTGFVTVGMAARGRKGCILDYAQSADSVVERILAGIVDSRYFDILSIWQCSMDPVFSKLARKLRFKCAGVLGLIEKQRSGNIPLLVRPVKQNPEEKDWLIDGMDMRDPENWFILEVASDAA